MLLTSRCYSSEFVAASADDDGQIRSISEPAVWGAAASTRYPQSPGAYADR